MFELEIDWHLTNRCNFYCEYCHPQIRKVLNIKDLNEPSPEECISAFNGLGKICHISMSGGEPFLFPKFVDLCQGLTQNHFISINTNLSSPIVSDFAETINPNRVIRIAAATHLVERERLGHQEEEYAVRYRVLRELNFPIVALYVLYPPLLQRCANDIKRLRSMGVDRISGKVFKGQYQGRTYPESYTEKERLQIQEVTGEYPYNRPYLQGLLSFKGEMCNAGKESIKVMVNGDIRRCATVNGRLGNLYEGAINLNAKPLPCPASRVLVVSQCLSNLVESPSIVSSLESQKVENEA